MNLDVIVFGAHPDDAELSMGGTISKLTKSNLNVGIVDLTKGEMGTRGSAQIRKKEAENAARILKIKIRENLSIPDGDIKLNEENLKKVVRVIRRFHPKIIFAPYLNDRHPDHINASALIKKAMFSSGLTKFKTADNKKTQKAYRPNRIFYYMQTYTFDPTFIIDISDTFNEKMKSVYAYKTQVYNPGQTKASGPETFISTPEFIGYIEARAKSYGFQIGKKYGEPFYSEEEIEMNLSGLLGM